MDEGMKPDIFEEMSLLLREAPLETELKEAMLAYMQDKLDEIGQWSELTLRTHEMLGGQSPRIYRAAAVTELIILSLDILDDIQDGDNLEKIWMREHVGLSAHLILTFLLLSLSSVASLAQQDIVHEIYRLLLSAGNGQFLDLRSDAAGEQEYIRVVEKKSGSLIMMAMVLGFIGTDVSLKEVGGLLQELSFKLGVYAQMINDQKDIADLRKNDLLQRKTTFATLYLAVNADALSFEWGDALSFAADGVQDNHTRLLRWIHSSGVQEYLELRKRLLLKECQAALERIPVPCPEKRSAILELFC